MLSGELRADTKNYFERLYAGGFAADATAAEQHRNERKTDVVQ
jgi:hypothetical protein